MERIIKRMRIYYFYEDAPAVPALENLVTELFYNEQGQEIREERIDEELRHYYDPGDGSLLRTTHDFPDGKREVTEYTYDLDSNLVLCHWEEQRVRDGYGNYLIFPGGAYSDEYYDWSNGGKTCTRTKETHRNDGTVYHEMQREEYNEKGWLRRVHHFNDDFCYECIEKLNYRHPGGELVQKEKWQSFLTEEGERRQTWSTERFADERIVSEEIYGVDYKGKVFSSDLTYEYEEDQEGYWIASRQIGKGHVHFTILREIEYW